MSNISANHSPFVLKVVPSPYYDDLNHINNRQHHHQNHLRTDYPNEVQTLDLISESASHAQQLNVNAKANEDLAHVPLEGVVKDKDNYFHIYLDVGRFSPKELSVQISNDHIIIEGKHEESQADDVGFLYRHFIRRYELPRGCNTEDMVSQLSLNGVVRITLPKTAMDSNRSITEGNNEMNHKNQEKEDDM